MDIELAFRAAVEGGRADEVRRLAAAHGELAEVIDAPSFAFDSPAIVHAAGMKDQALVDALLDAGADIDRRSAWRPGPYSALHRLVDGQTDESLALAEHLLRRGATLDLHAAAGLGRIEALTAMLDAEPDRVSEPGPDGATPLHLARNVETASFLLERGAEIDKRCVDHRSTAAQWALGDRPEVARYLIERGARADLFMAAVFDDVELARGLLEADPSAIDVRVGGGRSHPHIGFGDKYFWGLGFVDTPIELARRRGHDAVYQLLLDRSPVAVKLIQASRRGDVAAVERLLSEDAGPLERLDEPTRCALLSGALTTVRRFLEMGLDPNVRDEGHGATPLHHAAWENRAGHVELLLAHGADRSLRDRSFDGTPEGWARHAGHDALAARLGSDERPARGWTREELHERGRGD
jgi:ankyrin repeat protein